MWRQHHLGLPSDNVIDLVQDRTIDALGKRDIETPVSYGSAVARNAAARLAQKQHVEARAMERVKSEFTRLQQSKLGVEEVVDMRLTIERMATIALEMDISDRLLLARLVNDETKREDSNSIRRIRERLRQC